MKNSALFIVTVLFAFFTKLHAQTKNLHDVYGGIEVSLSTTMGGGMNRYDNVILFRSDGTFNHQIEKPDWKTRVTGKYLVDGQDIILQYNGGKKDKFKLEADGDLDAGSYSLLKLNTFNSVPPGYYRFNHISSSGGGSTGMVYVGTSSNTGLYFDGKGNFSRNRSSATMVSGSNVGGGTSNKNNGAGTYTIAEGVLTLKYNDGHTETHSFFSRPREKPIMAVVDGNIYFMDDEDKSKQTAASSPSEKDNDHNIPSADSNTAANNATDAQSILSNAHIALGGARLDAIKTLRVTATTGGINALIKMDLDAQKVRVELRKGQQQVLVEQLTANEGWQWKNGKKDNLPAARVLEMQQSLRGGPLAFRKVNMSRMQDVKVQPIKNNMTMVTYKIDGTTNFAVLSNNNQLAGEGTKVNQQMETSAYTSYKTIDGVVFPATEIQTSGLQKSTISYTSYTINPDFIDNDWGIPAL